MYVAITTTTTAVTKHGYQLSAKKLACNEKTFVQTHWTSNAAVSGKQKRLLSRKACWKFGVKKVCLFKEKFCEIFFFNIRSQCSFCKIFRTWALAVKLKNILRKACLIAITTRHVFHKKMFYASKMKKLLTKNRRNILKCWRPPGKLLALT